MAALEERCRRRGVPIERALPCVSSRDGDTLWVDDTHEAWRLVSRRRGLGDLTAAGLSLLGLTPERVESVTGRPCACHSRRQALNAAGRWIGIGRD